MEANLAEAERRISEVRRSRAEALDLGDLALRELPASVEDLPHLKALSLGLKKLTETGELQWGDDREAEIEDLSPLAGLQGLQLLDLTGCGEVSDISPLAGLQGLRSLNLWRVDIADLSPLAGLRELQSLDLSDLDVTDLAPLAGLQKLQRLDLSECRDLKDLTPLAGLLGLQRLDLYGCRPAVPAGLLRALAALPHLTELLVDKADGVPREILTEDGNDPFDATDNCLPRLRAYLAEVALGAEPENEVKGDRPRQWRRWEKPALPAPPGSALR